LGTDMAIEPQACLFPPLPCDLDRGKLEAAPLTQTWEFVF
jgi:hypothetical protein